MNERLERPRPHSKILSSYCRILKCLNSVDGDQDGEQPQASFCHIHQQAAQAVSKVRTEAKILKMISYLQSHFMEPPSDHFLGICLILFSEMLVK